MMSMGFMFWKDNGGGAMMCLIVRPTLSIMARLRFCYAIIQSSRVLLLALLMIISVADIPDTGIEFHVCGRRIALSDDL
jgi:hypothetical protein